MGLKSVLWTGLVVGALAFPGASAMAFDIQPMPRTADGRALAAAPNAAFGQREGEYMRSFQQQDAYAYQYSPTQRRGSTMLLLGGRTSGEELAARRADRAPDSVAPADLRDRTCWDCEQEQVDGLWVLTPRD